MNAQTQTEPAPTAAEYAQGIIDERVRLNAEQRHELELKEQRKIPLESGDYKVVESLDKKIEQCLQRQVRIEERLEILQTRHEDAIAAEQIAADIALAGQAEQLRQQGIKLMQRDYPRVAKVMVKLFERMDAVDAQISALNSQMKDSDHRVSYPNEVRTTPGYTEEKQVMAGGYTLDSPNHPRHGTPTYFNVKNGRVCYAGSDEPVEIHPSYITRTYEVAAVRQPFITNEAKLPGIWPTQVTS